MNTKTAVERVKQLRWDSSDFKASIENLVVDYDEALKLAQELDAARATLKEIAEKGGKWGAEMARRRLGVMC